MSNSKPNSESKIDHSDFTKVDIRVGEVIKMAGCSEAKKPAYKLTIDFGSEIGQKRSSVRMTEHYSKEELIGRQVLAVVNFPPKRIGPLVSDVLTLGLPDEDGRMVLAEPTQDVPKGGRLF